MWRTDIDTRFAPALLTIGLALAGCTTPPARQAGAPPAQRVAAPMAGTSAGACDASTLSAAARERAGTGCDVTATQGTARIAGCDDGPQVAYRGPAMGTLGNPRARRIEPHGQADSCN